MMRRILGFKPRLQVRLSAGPQHLTAPDGSKLEFKKRDGQCALLPRAAADGQRPPAAAR